VADPQIKVALTIAGSDSGGGAGIQADLKAFASLGLHGTCAITALTAQNTREVSAVMPVLPAFVLAQIRAVLADFEIAAVKVGMLGTAEVTHAVAEGLSELPAGTPVVVDPVMVAESGGRLLAQEAEGALVAEILPLASVVTPNLPEARALLGRASGADDLSESEEAAQLARSILELGPEAVLLTGGHREQAVDLLAVAGADLLEIAGPRHPDGAAHGSGCTHSSVLAGALALGMPLERAARTARRTAGEAVGRGLREIGAGAGPVDVLDLRRHPAPG
jgi:hydroxymethylpyrimidine/phosphomethylpyrimidine kinase